MSRLARVIEKCAISQCRIAPHLLKCAGQRAFSGVCRIARCEECKGSAGIFLCEACSAMTLCFHMFLCGCIIEPMGFFLLSFKSTRPNMKSAGWQRQLECAGPRSFAGVCRFVGGEEQSWRKSVCFSPKRVLQSCRAFSWS